MAKRKPSGLKQIRERAKSMAPMQPRPRPLKLIIPDSVRPPAKKMKPRPKTKTRSNGVDRRRGAPERYLIG